MTKAMKALRKLYDGYCQAADEFGGEYPHADYNLVKAALEENKALKEEIKALESNREFGQACCVQWERDYINLKAVLADKEALLDRERLMKILWAFKESIDYKRTINRLISQKDIDKAIAAIKESEDK